MSGEWKNTLLADFSVLPSRPEVSKVEEFLYKKVKLNMSHVRTIQFHNTRHCVLIEMVDIETARQYQRLNNLKHKMVSNNSAYTIPIYVEDGNISVRIHDLPPSTPAQVITECLQQYGSVYSIALERWKHYFPGVPNGVRVVNMKLNRPIPSYLTVGGHLAMITYDGQEKSCRFCNRKAHPKLKCGDVSSSNQQQAATQPTSLSKDDFPVISQNKTVPKQKQQPQPQPNTDEIQKDDDEDSSTDSIAAGTSTYTKRRLTTKRGNEQKKTCQSLPSSSSGTLNDNCFVLLSPMDEDTEGKTTEEIKCN